MTVINSQGTNVYVGYVPLIPYVSCDGAIVHLQNHGYKVVCPQILSEIKQFREINEYMCLASDQPVVHANEIDMANVSLQMLFDPDDIAGQEQIKKAFRTNISLLFGVVIDKKTILLFEGLIMSMKVKIEQNEAIKFDIDILTTTIVTECSINIISSLVLSTSRSRESSVTIEPINAVYLSFTTSRSRTASVALSINISEVQLASSRSRGASIIITESPYDCDVPYDCDMFMLCGPPMPPHSIFYCGASFDCDVPMLCYNTTNLKEN